MLSIFIWSSIKIYGHAIVGRTLCAKLTKLSTGVLNSGIRFAGVSRGRRKQ